MVLSLFLVACSQSPQPTTAPTATPAPPSLKVVDAGPLISGQAIAARGEHFPPEVPISFSLDQQPLKDSDHQPITARSDGDGVFVVIIHLLPEWAAGPHTLAASAGQKQASTIFLIVAPTPTPTPPPDATATPQPPVGRLYVAPLIATTDCGETRGLFQIVNIGSGTLAWELAYDLNIFTITPTHAIMDPGQTIILTITKHVAGQDSITINSNVGAQTVEVDC